MTTEQSHETSADHSCGCGHDHGESHESPKPQEVVVESPQPQTESGKLITITAKAAEKINEFMAEEKEKPEFLRIYVQGGGCSGLSYGMGFEKAAEEDDLTIEENGVKVIVDSLTVRNIFRVQMWTTLKVSWDLDSKSIILMLPNQLLLWFIVQY